MCEIVVINKGDKEIESPRELREVFGLCPIDYQYYEKHEVGLDDCLCQVDLSAYFKDVGVAFTEDGDDYLIDKWPI